MPPPPPNSFTNVSLAYPDLKMIKQCKNLLKNEDRGCTTIPGDKKTVASGWWLFELNVKLWCQKVKEKKGYEMYG